MKKEEGHTRCVFVFDNFVVKIAKVYWWNAIKTFYYEIVHEIKFFKKHKGRYFNAKFEKANEHEISFMDYEKHRVQKENQLQIKILTIKSYKFHATVSFMLGGIMANLQEWRFYKETKNPFCMPTLFSFFGLFNIQKKGGKVDFWGRNEIWSYIYHNSKDSNQPFCDGHTLAEPENYGMDNGKLKLVDYGSRQVGEYLKINGETLYNNFKHPN
jgi:hypothetical protein